MKGKRLAHREKEYTSQETGSASLFQGLRIRLTLWYCGVLGATLVLFGVALYLGTRSALLAPIASDTVVHVNVHTDAWRSGSRDHACPLLDEQQMPGQSFQMPEEVVCFDQSGKLLPGQNVAGLPSAFLTTPLVKTALQTGRPATGIIYTGGKTGAIYCYAVVVSSAKEDSGTGVLLVGESVEAQETALAELLELLLIFGAVALLGAGLGGLFLANRALVPARLAWANQQRFIADAAHELRTPLTLLRADAEVLLRGRQRLGEDDALLLEDIVTEASHMSHLATNLLTLARLDAHSMHQEHEVVDLAEMTRAQVRRVQALADQAEVSIQAEAGEAILVIGDSALLEQAILALLDNAIKYNRQGGRVTACVKAEDQRALLEISDTGIGISPEHLPYLGERFYRVDKARSRQAGGTGLGLSIVQSIAAAHGGHLALDSVPDQGTAVTLTFPLARKIVSQHLA